MLRKGVPFFGQLETCGNGPLKECADIGEIDELWATCKESIVQLVKKFRSDPWEQELHKLVLEDARLGWMTAPMPITKEQIGSI